MKTHILALSISTALLASASFAPAKDVPLEAGGKKVLTMTVPDKATVKSKEGKTTVTTKELRLYVWEVPTAKKVSDVVPKVGDVIKGEFINFVVGAKDKMKVAGHDAVHLTGKGAEADDNDPGTADVVVFTDGTHVFTACVHGEGDDAEKERPELMKVLKSIKAP